MGRAETKLIEPRLTQEKACLRWSGAITRAGSTLAAFSVTMLHQGLLTSVRATLSPAHWPGCLQPLLTAFPSTAPRGTEGLKSLVQAGSLFNVTLSLPTINRAFIFTAVFFPETSRENICFGRLGRMQDFAARS